MPRSRPLRGRVKELSTLGQARDGASGRGKLVLVRGAAGSGRSSLLAAVARKWRGAGVHVIETGFSAGTAPLQAIVEAVRADFEVLGEPRMVDAVAAISRYSARGYTSDPVHLLGLVQQLSTMIGLIVARGPAALLVDDADAAEAAAPVLDTTRVAGCLVVAAVSSSGGASVPLRTLADTVVDLSPLSAAAVGALLADRFGTPVDPGVVAALRAAFGPLGGNPAALLDAADELGRPGLLAEVHGRLCLAGPRVPIALPGPAFGRLVRGFDAATVEFLARIAVTPVGLNELPLLAGFANASTPDLGALADRLLDAGLLMLTTQGLLRCSAVAIENHLIAVVGPAAVAAQRRAVTLAVLARAMNNLSAESAPPNERAIAADQVAHAGCALAPGEAPAKLLLVAAAEPGTSPQRAADWLEAALLHTHDRVQRRWITAELLRLQMRTGRYDQMAATVDAALAEPGSPADEVREDVAAAAMLAAVHTGVPIGDEVRRRLDADERPLPAVQFADRWFTGAGDARALRETGRSRNARPLLSAAELSRIAIAETGPGDLADAFETVLGERYSPGGRTLPAIYGRVLRGYRDGDFTAALSAARELETSFSCSTPMNELARIWAAEMSRAMGDVEGGRGWLAAVSRPQLFPALAAWAECGLALAGQPDDDGVRAAFEVGRRAWELISRSPGHGAAELVPRLALLAVECGQEQAAKELLFDINLSYRRERHPLLAEAQLLTQAVVRHDAEAARQAVEHARAQGHRPRLLRACLVAGIESAEPEPWLHEAYALAKAMRADLLCGQVRWQMRRRGVSAPRAKRTERSFTDAELRILESICAGLTNRKIARQEHMSEKTVEEYVSRLLARTGCRTRVQLATARLTGRLEDAVREELAG